MNDYYLAPALAGLRTEIDRRWPGRNKASDGWVGDTSHQARKSDHNPDWSAGGVVRAIDVTADGNGSLADEVMAAAIQDPRVWYVIHDRLIYSRTHAWAARTYTGANPHVHHVHISLQGTNGISRDAARRIEEDTSPWFASLARVPTPTHVERARRQLRSTIDLLRGVPRSRVAVHRTADRLEQDLQGLPEK